MKQIRLIALFLLAGIVLISCASTKGAAGSDSAVPGIGNEFTAGSVLMTAGKSWGNAVQVAKFHPAVQYDGVECVEMEAAYGESTLAWNFHGLEPNKPVEVEFAVNFDFFGSDTFLEFAYLPGVWTAENGLDPRLEFKDAMVHKWVDGEAEWPDATEGWETVRFTELAADENGDFTVMMVVGHWTETPPVVYGNFTNPVVRTLKE